MVHRRAPILVLALLLTAPLVLTRSVAGEADCTWTSSSRLGTNLPDECLDPNDAAPQQAETMEAVGLVPMDMRSLRLVKAPELPILAPTSQSAHSTASEDGSCPSDGPLSIPTDCTEELNATDRTRQYRVIAPAGQTLVLRVTMTTETGADWLACLLHGVGGGTCSEGESGETVTIPTAVAEDTAYTVWLNSHFSNATLHLSVAAHAWTLGPDCGTGADTTPTTPYPLAVGSSCAGSLNPQTDIEDGYVLDVGAGEAVTVTLQPNPEADFDMCAQDSAGVTITCALAPFGKPDPLYLSPTAGDSFLLRPYVYDGAENYTIHVTAAAPQSDCGLGGDAGSQQREVPMSDPFTCEGQLDPVAGDAWDVYSLTIPAGGIRIALESSTSQVDACLYPPAGGWAQVCTTPGEDQAYMMAEEGTWMVGIRASEAASYQVSAWSFTPSAQDDCGSGTDAGDSRHPGGRLPFSAPGTCEGVLRVDEGDQNDPLTFTIPEARMRVQIESAANLGYCLSGPTFGWCNNTATRPDFTIETLEPGQWNLSLWGAWPTPDAPLSYEVHVETSAPRDDCATGGDGGSYSPRRPRPLATPTFHCTGWLMLASYDDNDAYAVDLLPTETLLVTFEGDTPNVEVCLRTIQGHELECHQGPPAEGVPITMSSTYLEAETLLITVDWVDGPRPPESRYDLTVVRATDLTRLVDTPPSL